ncbi:MAG: hypothetical protein DDT38_00068 [Firmicutes bacterium]|nr:hypothetical protein [candidate division NPL-UPA2 bacterium]
MLYTIIPEEIVLADLEKVSASQEITFRGRRLRVLPLPDGKYQIVQLISSNPCDFLSPEFAPGKIL